MQKITTNKIKPKTLFHSNFFIDEALIEVLIDNKFSF
jgi:hypothetical protein